MELGLQGRRALVTGSHRGTGAATARVLAREGAHVLVHGFELEAAESVAASIRGAGHQASAVSGDIRSDEGAAAVVQAAGSVDVLVNNYGVAEGGSWQSPSSDWVDLYQKNVLSAVRVTQGLVPGMRERGFGRVIFLSTAGTHRPAARMPHYYAAKTALLNATLSLSLELAGSGVTVNVVSPGMLATEEVVAGLKRRAAREGHAADWPEVEALAAREWIPNPTRRLGRPEEVGELVAFLASDLAGYINGANLRIDGGATQTL